MKDGVANLNLYTHVSEMLQQEQVFETWNFSPIFVKYFFSSRV